MERNYAEDQANEVEALESIYCSDIEGKNCRETLNFEFDCRKNPDLLK